MSDELPTRNVASQPISKSFKGILRISNVKDLDQNDVFLNPSYYGEYQPSAVSPSWEPVGLQATDNILSGKNTRYVTSNAYTTLKIPVTDSLGNYLNFSLGADSSSIGNTIETGIWSLRGPEFYTLSSDSISIGLSEIHLKHDKNIKGGKLFIDNKNAEIGKLIVNNYYQHGVSDTVEEFTKVDAKTKTIYQGSAKNNLYDAFLFRQDDVSNEIKSDTDNSVIQQQATVKLTNLKDYVMDKIGAYIKYNTTEIPPGTIVNQYCSLDKWYCRSEGNIFDDSTEWQGFRPALGGVSSTFSEDNTVQGVYSNASKLEYNMTSYAFESVEMPPDFKRGYVLADGSAYTINFTPPYSNDVASLKNSNKTLDLFFDLFFTIGYYYTPSVDLFPHVYYEADEAPVNADETLKSKATYGRYYYDYNLPAKQEYGWTRISAANHPIDNETLYGISLVTALAFNKFKEVYQNKYEFNKYIADADGNWDIEKSIDWLSKQPIDERYIFNTIFSDDSIESEPTPEEGKTKNIDNLIYRYKNENRDFIIDIPLGKEVKSFSDYIEYYEVGQDINGVSKISKTYCQIYKTAEVYDIARLFSIKSTEWGNYMIRFNVPALYTDSDNSINEFNSMTGNSNSNKIGLFIGSNGLNLAESITIPSKNATESESLVYNNLDKYTYYQSNCLFTIGYQPHSHALAKGSLYLKEGNYEYDPEKIPVHLSPLSIARNASSEVNEALSRQEGAKNILADLSEIEKNIISADTTWAATMLKSEKEGPQKWADEPPAWNYFLQENGPSQNVKLTNIFNAYNGLMGKEMAVFQTDSKGKITDEVDKNMLWYARTSEPLWDPNEISSSTSKKYTENDNPGYFRPQSIKLLPLIKL